MRGPWWGLDDGAGFCREGVLVAGISFVRIGEALFCRCFAGKEDCPDGEGWFCRETGKAFFRERGLAGKGGTRRGCRRVLGNCLVRGVAVDSRLTGEGHRKLANFCGCTVFERRRRHGKM